MRRLMLLLCMLIISGSFVNQGLAASGKCTVVTVEGDRMVIECNQQAKGFSKGNQIKIKSDKGKSGGKQ